MVMPSVSVNTSGSAAPLALLTVRPFVRENMAVRGSIVESITGGTPPDGGFVETLAVVGDFGDGSDAAYDVAGMTQSDFGASRWITTGDNNYPAGAAATFADAISPYQTPYDESVFVPALGNHDWDGCSL